MQRRNGHSYHRSAGAHLELMRQESVQKRINESESRLREDIKAGFDSMRAEFESMRSEMRTEIESVRTEIESVRTEIESVRTEIDAKHDKLVSKFELFQMWMYGLVFAMLIGFMGLFFAVIFTR